MEARKGNAIIIILVIASIISLAGVGYLFWQNRNLQMSLNEKATLPAISATPTTQLAVSPVSSPTVSPLSPTAAKSVAVVVFEAAGSIPQADKDALYNKVVNPFLDYYSDLQGKDYVVSFTIDINNNPSKTTYPYGGKGIFKNGAFESFLISKTAGVIDWWLPTCMAKCEFSESFKAKYPEIVKKSP